MCTGGIVWYVEEIYERYLGVLRNIKGDSISLMDIMTDYIVRLRLVLVCLVLLGFGLLLLWVAAGCGSQFYGGLVDDRSLDDVPTESPTTSLDVLAEVREEESQLTPGDFGIPDEVKSHSNGLLATDELSIPKGSVASDVREKEAVDAVGANVAEPIHAVFDPTDINSPCAGIGKLDGSCETRDVSRFVLFSARRGGSAYFDEENVHSYANYNTSDYLLGAGPNVITVAYDHIGEARSYDLYRRTHAAGEFGDEILMTETEYQTALQRVVWAAESLLAGILEGREEMVFLAPMGAHNAIAVEAWQAVAQWDVLARGDGTTYLHISKMVLPTVNSGPLTHTKSRTSC